MTNSELFKNWYFNELRPIGFDFRILSNIRSHLDTLDTLYNKGIFRQEQVDKMKLAYLKRFSR